MLIQYTSFCIDTKTNFLKTLKNISMLFFFLFNITEILSLNKRK